MSKDPAVVVARTKGPEFTNVSDETERKIPFRTWLTCIFVSSVDVLALAGILVLGSRQVWNWKNPPRVYGYGWWSSTSRTLEIWWPTIGIAMLVSVILWSIPLQYRYLIETVAKNPPLFAPLDPREGLWTPWRRQYRWDEEDEEEPEMEATAETANVTLWDRLKGRLRMRNLDLLTGQEARTFYRAVTADPPLASFSERGAVDCGINPATFRREIRGPLFAQGLACWKNEKRHNLGIDISDEGMQLLEQRAHPPLPRGRA